jgi:hypothetical protein
MTKIITCSELRYRTLDELEALFRTLQIEFGRPVSPERTVMLASLESVRRAMARRASAGSQSRETRARGRGSVPRLSAW